LKVRILVVLICLIVIFTNAEGQSIARCQKVYTSVHVMPSYKSGMNDLLAYVSEELSPLFNDYPDKEEMIVLKKHIVELTIDYNGQVVEVNFPKSTLLRSFLDEVKEKIKTMEGWNPGQLNGENVCTKLTLPIQFEPNRN
jgi:hypothetical protein